MRTLALALLIASGCALPEDFGGGAFTAVGGVDMFVLKLDPMGNHLWSGSFGGMGDQIGYAIAVDGAGNAIVGGSYTNSIELGQTTFGGGAAETAVLFKLAADGTMLWAHGFGSGTKARITGVALGPGDSIAAVGVFVDGIGIPIGSVVPAGGEDTFVLKASP